jgi:ribosomal-protein-alanine N-acetyltransferase
MDVKISRMQEKDINEIVNIEKLSFISPWSKSSFLNELRNEVSYSFVAKTKIEGCKIVVGYIIFWIVCNEAHILNIAVHPYFRRKGIGRKLLIYALKCSLIKNVEDIYLEVRSSNIPAIKLYEGLGFVSLGIRPHYYMDNGEDAIIMAFNFKDASISFQDSL